MKFYIGLHQPYDARHFKRAFISINRVRGRKSEVPCDDWILDSAAFSELHRHGRYRHTPTDYAAEINRLAAINPGLKCAVAQDYMCEPQILEKTGLTVADHQRLTIQRYCMLKPLVTPAVYLMPVLQGYSLQSYLDHIDQYGDLLPIGAYVGVGSICKRNADMRQIEAILCAIKNKRPDLRLHGFGLKATALHSGAVRDCLYSADSMAWSFAARRNGGGQNDWRLAEAFIGMLDRQPVQYGWRF